MSEKESTPVGNSSTNDQAEHGFSYGYVEDQAHPFGADPGPAVGAAPVEGDQPVGRHAAHVPLPRDTSGVPTQAQQSIPQTSSGWDDIQATPQQYEAQPVGTPSPRSWDEQHQPQRSVATQPAQATPAAPHRGAHQQSTEAHDNQWGSTPAPTHHPAAANTTAPAAWDAPAQPAPRRKPFPTKTLPDGWPVGSFSTYAKAQQAVDVLSDTGDFPVNEVSIVGVNLMEVEHVVGRLSWGKVIGRGAVSGAWMGLFFGLLISLFNSNAITPMIMGFGLGIVFGIISAAVPYALTRGQRDFATTTQIVAGRYDIICAKEHAPRARDIIARASIT